MATGSKRHLTWIFLTLWLATGVGVAGWLFSDGTFNNGQGSEAMMAAPNNAPAETASEEALGWGGGEDELPEDFFEADAYGNEHYAEIEPGAGNPSADDSWTDDSWGSEQPDLAPPMASAAPSVSEDFSLELPMDDDDGSMLGTSIALSDEEPASPSDQPTAKPSAARIKQFSAPTFSAKQAQSRPPTAWHQGKLSNGRASVAIPQRQATAKLSPPKAMAARPPRMATPQSSAARFTMPPEAITPSAIDHALEKMQLGSIAFNTPEEIPFGETATIELLLSPKENEAVLSTRVQGHGPVETARIKISNQMEASLTGLGFDVEPITNEIQAISHNEPTVWRWHIEPNRTDVQPLHLTLTAHLKVDGDKMTRTVKTFEREISIQVPFTTRVYELASGHSEILISMLIVPLAASFWRRYRSKKSLESAEESSARSSDVPASDETRQAA